MSKVCSAWNGDYLPGKPVSLYIELDRHDLDQILDDAGLAEAELEPVDAYRVLRLESQRRLLAQLRAEYGEPPNIRVRRLDLDRQWKALLNRILTSP